MFMYFCSLVIHNLIDHQPLTFLLLALIVKVDLSSSAGVSNAFIPLFLWVLILLFSFLATT